MPSEFVEGGNARDLIKRSERRKLWETLVGFKWFNPKCEVNGNGRRDAGRRDDQTHAAPFWATSYRDFSARIPRSVFRNRIGATAPANWRPRMAVNGNGKTWLRNPL